MKVSLDEGAVLKLSSLYAGGAAAAALIAPNKFQDTIYDTVRRSDQAEQPGWRYGRRLPRSSLSPSSKALLRRGGCLQGGTGLCRGQARQLLACLLIAATTA